MPPKGNGWIDIQNRTFTNWVNLQLAKPIVCGADEPRTVAALDEDLKDGELLLGCLEGCIDEKFPGKKKIAPKTKIMQLENLSGAFKFMADHGVKLVNIGPADVNDGHKKLILGMIWSIISKFQIVSHLEDSSHHGSAKELLLEWINTKITSKEVTDFKADWHDGVLLQELTNKIGEDIYGAGTTLLQDAAADDTARAAAAINTACDKLCVGKLILAEDLTGAVCDEHSTMTYLSLFRDAMDPKDRRASMLDGVGASGGDDEVAPSEPVAEEEEVVAPVSSRVPPGERAADWRVYEGIDLGGRCKIRVFYSTTTHDALIRKSTEALGTLLEALQVHKRPDFEPWVALDMDMEKSFRDKIFEKAGTRKSPFLFIDDEYVGGYEQVKEMNDRGELQPILDY